MIDNDDIRRALASIAADGDLLNLEAAASDDHPPRDVSAALIAVLKDLVSRRLDFAAAQEGFGSRPGPLPSAPSLEPYPKGWRVLNGSASVFTIAHNGSSYEVLPGGVAYLPADWSGDLPENAPTETAAYRHGIKVSPCTFSMRALANRVRMLSSHYTRAKTPAEALPFACAMVATVEQMAPSPERAGWEPQARAAVERAQERIAAAKRDAAATPEGIGGAPVSKFAKRAKPAAGRTTATLSDAYEALETAEDES